MAYFRIVFVICFLLPLTAAHSQTEVSGNVNGVWSLDDAPFIVTGNVTVERNNQLIIEPGVEILFRGYFRLIVYGTISAIGEPDSPITFTTEDIGNWWNGIRLYNSQNENSFEYCRFTRSHQTIDYPSVDSRGGAIYSESSQIFIRNCIFENNRASGQGGAVCLYDCTGEFTDCVIRNNFGFTEIIWFQSSNLPFLRNTLTNNEGTHGAGLLIDGTAQLVADNVFSYNRSNTMRWGGALYFVNGSRCWVENNLLHHNSGGGLYVGYNSNITANHLTIADNSGRCGTLVVSSSTLNITNSIFWDNETTDFWITDHSTCIMTYSNCENPGEVEGDENCINQDPLFINPDDENYRLAVNSPCRDNGNPDSPDDPDGSRADMGYLYPIQYNLLIDPDSVDFGIVGIPQHPDLRISVIYETENDNLPPLRLNCALVDPNRLFQVAPLNFSIQPNEQRDITLSVDIPLNSNIGPGSALLNIYIDNADEPHFSIPISIFVVAGFGTLNGIVFDALSEEPIPNAEITLEGLHYQSVSNESGRFTFENLPAWAYTAHVEIPDYLPFTSAEFIIEPDDRIFLEIPLLYAKCDVLNDSLIVHITPDSSACRTMQLSNPGSGPLRFNVRYQFPPEQEAWALRYSINAYDATRSRDICGIEFAGGYYYLSSSGTLRERGQIFVLDENFRLVHNFSLFMDSSWGIRDLTWDGELLWGADGGRVFGFTPQGELITTFAAPRNPSRSIAWDATRSILWIANVYTDIYGIDRQGRIITQINQQGNLHTYGMGFFPNDPDGFPLYLFNDDGPTRAQINKVNPVNGDFRFVTDLPIDNGNAGGLTITHSLDPISVMAIALIEGDFNSPDIVNFYHLASGSDWIGLSDSVGVIAAGSILEVGVTFSSAGFPVDATLEAELIIEHNGRGEPSRLPVKMIVIDPNSTGKVNNDFAFPTKLHLIEPYPQPTNSVVRITYQIPHSGIVSLNLLDINGRILKNIIDKHHSTGSYSTDISLDEIPSGVYLLDLRSLNEVSRQRLTLIK